MDYVLLLSLFLAACSCSFGQAAAEEDELSFALNYLNRYHYISPTRSGNHDVTAAFKMFQRYMGLPITGSLNDATLAEMRKSRCGMPDVKPVQEGRFHTWNSWRKNDLKYHLSFTRDIPVAEQERIFTAAFKQYADASPNLKLTRVKTPAEADIKVSFGRKVHAGPGEKTCAKPHDGRVAFGRNELAHSFLPEDGRIHIDDDEHWRDNSRWSWHSNILPVALHEIGHALGLQHTGVFGAAMFPTYNRHTRTLSKDDKEGIRALYG